MCVFDNDFLNLSTLLGRPEYAEIQLSKIAQEFIKEHNLNSSAQKRWVYFEIRLGCCGLPQSRIIANKQLRLRLEKEGYYKTRTTLVL